MKRKQALTLSLATVLAAGGASTAVAQPSEDEFIMGVDIGMLPEVEELGGEFFTDGNQGDALEIMADSGANYVRLRLWHDPYNAEGEPYGGGTNDLARTIEVAQRADELGMGIMLNFHLSDWWADPGDQHKPKAWRELSYEELVDTVEAYTYDVITEMEAAGVAPEVAQIGNEIPSGILWEDGRVGDGIDDFTQLGELLQAGVNGVSSANADIEIALHLDMGGDNDLYRWWFDGVTSQGVDFDIIALSYYPFWHGSMGDLKANLNDITTRYDKDVMIVETAYGWTLEDGDGLGNSFYIAEEEEGGYPATVEGQTAFLQDLREIVEDVPGDRGRGVFWWEPTWLPVEGAHWGTEVGKEDNDDPGELNNPWDNQTLFDWEGNVLPTLSVFGQELGRSSVLENGSFEADGYTNNPTAWQVTAEDDSSSDAVFTSSDWTVHGEYKLTLWSDEAYEVTVSQSVEGLEDGHYILSAWVLSSGDQEEAYLFASDGASSEAQQELPSSDVDWQYVVIDGVTVENGQLEVGLHTDADADSWINVDDVKLYLTP